MDIQRVSQNPGVQIGADAVGGEKIGLLGNAVAGLFPGFNGKALVLERLHCFPHSVPADSQLFGQDSAGAELSVCLCQTGGNGFFYLHAEASFPETAGMPKRASPFRQVFDRIVWVSVPRTSAAACAV